jgi:hypothetical protein
MDKTLRDNLRVGEVITRKFGGSTEAWEVTGLSDDRRFFWVQNMKDGFYEFMDLSGDTWIK